MTATSGTRSEVRQPAPPGQPVVGRRSPSVIPWIR